MAGGIEVESRSIFVANTIAGTGAGWYTFATLLHLYTEIYADPR